MWAAAGIPLAQVGDWIGHADETTTQIYRHASVDFEAFALETLERFNQSRGVARALQDDREAPVTTGNDRVAEPRNQAVNGSAIPIRLTS